MLGAEFKLPSIISEEESADRKAPISLKFEIPYFTVSGIQVCILNFSGKSFESLLIYTHSTSMLL